MFGIHPHLHLSCATPTVYRPCHRGGDDCHVHGHGWLLRYPCCRGGVVYRLPVEASSPWSLRRQLAAVATLRMASAPLAQQRQAAPSRFPLQALLALLLIFQLPCAPLLSQQLPLVPPRLGLRLLRQPLPARALLALQPLVLQLRRKLLLLRKQCVGAFLRAILR